MKLIVTTPLACIMFFVTLLNHAISQMPFAIELEVDPKNAKASLKWNGREPIALQRSKDFIEWETIWKTYGASSHSEPLEPPVFFRNASVKPPIKTPPHKLVGHRGGTVWTHPENTKVAWEAGALLGLRSIEADINLSADGQLFVMHDLGSGGLKRTTNIESIFPERAGNPPKSFTIDELKMLDAGSWKGTQFSGQDVPTLKEFLHFCRDNSITPVLDVKGNFNHEIRQECAEIEFPLSLLHISAGLGFSQVLNDLSGDVLYTSTFSNNSFVLNPETAPDWFIAQIKNSFRADGIVALGSIQPEFDTFNPLDWIKWKAGGVAPIYYLANTVSVAETVKENGFVGVWTDNAIAFVGTAYLNSDTE